MLAIFFWDSRHSFIVSRPCDFVKADNFSLLFQFSPLSLLSVTLSVRNVFFFRSYHVVSSLISIFFISLQFLRILLDFRMLSVKLRKLEESPSSFEFVHRKGWLYTFVNYLLVVSYTSFSVTCISEHTHTHSKEKINKHSINLARIKWKLSTQRLR